VEELGVENADCTQCDISTWETISGLLDTIRHIYGTHGKIDILVNNAGVNKPNDFMDIVGSEWDIVLNVNLRGAFQVTKCLHDIINDGGSIINIGSVSAFTGGPKTTHYCASKSGLVGLTQNMALVFAKRNIRCNIVAPGYIESKMATSGAKSDAVAEQIGRVPLGRMGTPKDVSGVVAFLASDLSKYMTGTVIHVNGGLYW